MKTLALALLTATFVLPAWARVPVGAPKPVCPNLWTVGKTCSRESGNGPDKVAFCQPFQSNEQYISFVNLEHGTVDAYKVTNSVMATGASNYYFQDYHQNRYHLSVGSRPFPKGRIGTLSRLKASDQVDWTAKYFCK